MCGIFINFSYKGKLLAPALKRADYFMNSLKSRGPDKSKTKILHNDSLFLGHTRLSIIDLRSIANQPMSDEKEQFSIIYNGEIYNYLSLRDQLSSIGYIFRTNSDTEVILASYQVWGKNMLKRFDGMFAFGIWDDKKKELFVARDQYGIKPLYFSAVNSEFVFSSQFKPFMKNYHSCFTVDESAWEEFELWGSFQGEKTPLKEVKVFPAGKSCVIDRTGKCSWDSFTNLFNSKPNNFEINNNKNHLKNTKKAVIESVGQQLKADTNKGVLLSGGLDSNLIATIAKEYFNTKLPAITIGFKEYQGTRFDEVKYARKGAGVLGLDHYVKYVSKLEFTKIKKCFFQDMDLPTIDGLNTWLAAREAKKLGLKVLFSGLGADEIFGGYPSFIDIPKIIKMEKFIKFTNQLPLIKNYFVHHKNPKYKYLVDYCDNIKMAYFLYRISFIKDKEKAQDFCKNYIKNNIHISSENKAELIAFLEINNYMKNQLLRDTDWASMSHGVELRVPFLSNKLINKYSPFGKSILLSICRNAYLNEIYKRPKTGFSVPIKSWMDLNLIQRENKNSTFVFNRYIKEEWLKSVKS